MCICVYTLYTDYVLLYMYIYIYIYISLSLYIYIYIYTHFIYVCYYTCIFTCVCISYMNPRPAEYTCITHNTYDTDVHPVSITIFPLRRPSPGAGLLRNLFVTLSMLRLSRGWVRKDRNLLTETGCNL